MFFFQPYFLHSFHPCFFHPCFFTDVFFTHLFFTHVFLTHPFHPYFLQSFYPCFFTHFFHPCFFFHPSFYTHTFYKVFTHVFFPLMFFAKFSREPPCLIYFYHNILIFPKFLQHFKFCRSFYKNIFSFFLRFYELLALPIKFLKPHVHSSSKFLPTTLFDFSLSAGAYYSMLL